MVALGIDTSTACVCVALVDSSGVLAQLCDVAPNRQGESLAPAVKAALESAGITRADLSTVGVGLGPGPFTGLRVGLVFAAALSDALQIPVHGVCSLDAVAAPHLRDRSTGLVAMTDARRKEVYWARYGADGARLDGPEVAKPAAVAADSLNTGELLVGAGAALYREVFAGFEVSDDCPYPDPVFIAQHALDLVGSGATPEPLTPLYLRRPDADDSFQLKSVLT